LQIANYPLQIAGVSGVRVFTATIADRGRRLDQFVAGQLSDVSRAWVQELIQQGRVQVDGRPAKPALKLRGSERVEITGGMQRPPLRAIPEDIPLNVIYEDDDLAVIDKPAGMMVHAGAGATESERNRGTLVNALLHYFKNLSGIGGQLRPGIVHRLDRHTSGLIVVARNDLAHRRLAEQFAGRAVRKTYLALVHGWPKGESGTITSAISRDVLRRTRMTTRRGGGRAAVSHWRVRERIDGPYGKFALVEVKIETGRTHQIRVHMASLGYPVAGDTLYGAPKRLQSIATTRAGTSASSEQTIALERNFLHAAVLEFKHPGDGRPLHFSTPLPQQLLNFLAQVRGGVQL
jgi:23S rRNA pseudouridine1911/1915/1917 synthase